MINFFPLLGFSVVEILHFVINEANATQASAHIVHDLVQENVGETFLFFNLSNFFSSAYVLLSRLGEIITLGHPGLIYPILAGLSTLSIFQFESLSDIVGVDLPALQNRFMVFYQLLSHDFALRFTFATSTTDLSWIVSVYNIYPNSNWSEREIWDMFGIGFFNHPDLRRLLSDYGFKGHPLRKDFPLVGYLEVKFNSIFEFIDYDQVSVALTLRMLSSLSVGEASKLSNHI